jgi:ribosomal protein S18 acetylase RimI-like enzyme
MLYVEYIQDIIVKPEYQRLGIGTIIMNEIIKYIIEEYPQGTMVCLMAAKGIENYYKKFGFIERPNEVYGAGMILCT